MTKFLTLAAVVLGLGVTMLLSGIDLTPSRVMADPAPLACQTVEVALDEGYGVSRREWRTDCPAR